MRLARQDANVITDFVKTALDSCAAPCSLLSRCIAAYLFALPTHAATLCLLSPPRPNGHHESWLSHTVPDLRRRTGRSCH